MEIEDYPSNSHMSKTPVNAKPATDKKVSKVIQGKAAVKKKTLAEKAKDTFIAEDVTRVKDYVISDVIIPNVKKAIDDIISNGVHMLLYGSSSPKTSSSNGRVSQHISYQSYYNQTKDRPTRAASIYNFDNILLENRGDGELVLDQLQELIDNYGQATVADFYECVGVSSEYTTNDYGWTNLRNACVVWTPDGYTIKMPRAVSLR